MLKVSFRKMNKLGKSYILDLNLGPNYNAQYYMTERKPIYQQGKQERSEQVRFGIKCW